MWLNHYGFLHEPHLILYLLISCVCRRRCVVGSTFWFSIFIQSFGKDETLFVLQKFSFRNLDLKLLWCTACLRNGAVAIFCGKQSGVVPVWTLTHFDRPVNFHSNAYAPNRQFMIQFAMWRWWTYRRCRSTPRRTPIRIWQDFIVQKVRFFSKLFTTIIQYYRRANNVYHSWIVVTVRKLDVITMM